MKKMMMHTQRFLSLGCGLGSLLSLCSVLEGANPFIALALALGLAFAAASLSRMALRNEKAILRAQRRAQRAGYRRAQRAGYRRAQRRLAASALAARSSAPAASRRPAADLQVA